MRTAALFLLLAAVPAVVAAPPEPVPTETTRQTRSLADLKTELWAALPMGTPRARVHAWFISQGHKIDRHESDTDISRAPWHCESLVYFLFDEAGKLTGIEVLDARLQMPASRR
jgi:hypothetical protein